MPKLTPEVFSSLDLNEQVRILQKVPADRLNDLHLVQFSDNTPDTEIYGILSDLIDSLPEDARAVLIVRLLELLAIYANEDAQRYGTEAPSKKVAMVLLLIQNLNQLKKDINRVVREDSDGDED